ncbi:helix-turn-helix domain-containing protein [bacterium]|nr:helix-turn-helix domain-containing protein [bacterium]
MSAVEKHIPVLTADQVAALRKMVQVTSQQAAWMCGYSDPQTINDAANAGELPFIANGRHRYYRPQDLDDWAESRKQRMNVVGVR